MEVWEEEGGQGESEALRLRVPGTLELPSGELGGRRNRGDGQEFGWVVSSRCAVDHGQTC